MDWLNEITEEGTYFFGLEIELWRIGESPIAPKFNIISKPNEWSKTVKTTAAKTELTETKKTQLEFWTMFREKLLASSVVSSAQTPRPQYWFDVALGRSGFYLSNIANTYDNRIGVRVYLSNKIANVALAQLEKQREEIEKEIGEELLWNPNPENRDKTICLYHDADLSNREEWSQYCDWFVDAVRRFRKVFMPRVKKLVLSNLDSE